MQPYKEAEEEFSKVRFDLEYWNIIVQSSVHINLMQEVGGSNYY